MFSKDQDNLQRSILSIFSPVLLHSSIALYCTAPIINEILLDAKTKLWNACKLGDNELLSSIIEKLMAKVKECEEQNKEDDVAGSASFPSNIALVNAEDVARLFNDMNEDGNTLLHLAAIGGYHDQVW